MTGTTFGDLFYRPAATVRGGEILPLNVLRDNYPELYEHHRSKYDYSPDVLAHEIGPLGSCRPRGSTRTDSDSAHASRIQRARPRSA